MAVPRRAGAAVGLLTARQQSTSRQSPVQPRSGSSWRNCPRLWCDSGCRPCFRSKDADRCRSGGRCEAAPILPSTCSIEQALEPESWIHYGVFQVFQQVLTRIAFHSSDSFRQPAESVWLPPLSLKAHFNNHDCREQHPRLLNS